MTEVNLSDEAIAQVAKVLQLAILTGTDIVDNLRQMKFIVADNSIKPSPEYKKNFEVWIETMMEEIRNNTVSTSSNDITAEEQLSLF